MSMEHDDSLLCVSSTHAEAERAIKCLSSCGFDITKLSLVGKGYHSEEHPLGFYTALDKMRAWGGVGAFWGGIWGLLVAPVLVGGTSALGAALTMIGVPDDLVIKYETALKAKKYVLIMHGNADEVAKARIVLADGGALSNPRQTPTLRASIPGRVQTAMTL
jgi:hypothetical protein